MAQLIGIDLGGTTVKIGFLSENGEILNNWQIPTDTEENGKNILTDIVKSIDEKIVEFGYEKNEFLGAGIGVPGPVTNDGVLLGAVNLGWKEEVRIEEKLSELLGLPVKADNDANVATIGEMWTGSGSGATDMIFVTLGTGVGGGVITNGSIVKGANGGGGEIGHITVELNEGEACNCGKTGCLETVASATGIVRETEKALSKFEGSSILQSYEKLNAKNIFDAAKNEDEFALSMVDQLGQYLGLALANIASTTNPKAIVIGGGVSKAGSILIDVIKKHFTRFVFAANKNVDFEIAKLENDAGIIGAAYLVK
jgi:glucokinase